MAKIEDLVFTMRADAGPFRRELRKVQRDIGYTRLAAWLSLIIAAGLGLVVGLAIGLAT